VLGNQSELSRMITPPFFNLPTELIAQLYLLKESIIIISNSSENSFIDSEKSSSDFKKTF